MNSLGIDTSSYGISLALIYNGSMLGEKQIADIGVAENLMPSILEILEQNNLTLAGLHKIAIISGPGSYTGLRSGLATVLGIKEANLNETLEVVSASKLLVQAHEVVDKINLTEKSSKIIFSLLTANENEFFISVYYFNLFLDGESDSAQPLREVSLPMIIKKEEFLNFKETFLNDLKNNSLSFKIKDFNSTDIIDIIDSPINFAVAIVKLARNFPNNTSENLEPLYIKPVNAKTLSERRD